MFLENIREVFDAEGNVQCVEFRHGKMNWQISSEMVDQASTALAKMTENEIIFGGLRSTLELLAGKAEQVFFE